MSFRETVASFAEILDAEMAAAEDRARSAAVPPSSVSGHFRAALGASSDPASGPSSAAPGVAWWVMPAEPVAPPAPAWARTLAAPFPCTERQLRAAFRKRAFDTHPDRGGNAHDFIEARRALETGLRELAERAPASRDVRVDRYRHAA